MLAKHSCLLLPMFKRPSRPGSDIHFKGKSTTLGPKHASAYRPKSNLTKMLLTLCIMHHMRSWSFSGAPNALSRRIQICAGNTASFLWCSKRCLSPRPQNLPKTSGPHGAHSFPVSGLLVGAALLPLVRRRKPGHRLLDDAGHCDLAALGAAGGGGFRSESFESHKTRGATAQRRRSVSRSLQTQGAPRKKWPDPKWWWFGYPWEIIRRGKGNVARATRPLRNTLCTLRG